MTKKLLIDASHAEETRVVVLDGNRLEDFDVETATRRQIKGNIYLAKVIRVEPSLQAAFVEYGGNRHGFLAFGEIHPDYYQIPIADRQRLLRQQAEDEAEEARADEARESRREAMGEAAGSAAPDETPETAQPLDVTSIAISAEPPPEFTGGPLIVGDDDGAALPQVHEAAAASSDEPGQTQAEYEEAAAPAEAPEDAEDADEGGLDEPEGDEPEAPPPEALGGDGDDAAEARERRQRQRFLRNYKIQDVIHRRQIMLIQVVKEERGNKGAALTTYLSLAGRFSVLMPNSPSGGGVSRKITSVADRRRLKEAMAELDVPEGMGLIVRTAGANRPKPEIIRDCEYLLRLWDDIRERTMQSTAPALIYEEASLIKRTIRDVYTRDVEDVLVDGEEGFKAAQDFMRMLMPGHARKVKLWTEGQPLFAKFQVEAQLDAMLNPIVQLRSGGYIVINQTEALVAIDVNSGRSTRERSIEDTALRTNLEAADEAARQLRMRDLAGLIVIDFIDMESRKNNVAVERRMKEALKNDRARIQIGAISHFGLMELSRQRLRPSLAEASLVLCPHCAGMGHVRSPESAALHILRAIEDEGAKFRAAEIAVVLPTEIALYLFNHKRDRLSAIEARYAMRVIFSGDPTLAGTNFRIEKIKAQTAPMPVQAPASYAGSMETERAAARPVSDRPGMDRVPPPVMEDDGEADDNEAAGADTAPVGETAEEGERRRRRRRRRGKRRGEPQGSPVPDVSAEGAGGEAEASTSGDAPADEPTELDMVLAASLIDTAEGAEGETPARRRRGRGGRRRRGEAPSGENFAAEPAVEATTAPFAEPVYADLADIFEAAERAEAEALRVRRQKPVTAEMSESLTAALESVAAVTVSNAEEAAADAAPAAIPEPVSGAADGEDAPVASPAKRVVQPIVIDQLADQGGERKRGWWRR